MTSIATEHAAKASRDHKGIGLINGVFAFSDEIKDDRSLYEILASATEELGELSTEVAIKEGFKQREPSVDGVVGEAIDLIICALDMIHIYNKDISSLEIEKMAIEKCIKWRKKKLPIKAK